MISRLHVLAAFALGVIALPLIVACGKKPVEEVSRKMSKLECERLLASAEAPVLAANKAADRACTKASDCAPATASPCFSDCDGTAIAKSAAPALAAVVAKARTTCQAYEDAGCMIYATRSIPSCAENVPTCDAGQCAPHFR
jgi:hypothetical protein